MQTNSSSSPEQQFGFQAPAGASVAGATTSHRPTITRSIDEVGREVAQLMALHADLVRHLDHQAQIAAELLQGHHDDRRFSGEQPQLLTGALNAIADGICIYARRLYARQVNLIRFNQAFLDLFALERDPTFCSHSEAERNQRLHTRDAETGQALSREALPLARVLAGEALAGETSVDLRMRALDGREVFVNVSGAPLHSPARDRHITGAILVLRDVTEHRRLEREVANSARRMSMTLDTMPDGVTLADEWGRIVLSNPAFQQLFALDRDPTFFSRLPAERGTLLNVTDPAGRPLHEEEMPATQALSGHVISGTQPLELHAHALDGREVDVSVTAAPFRDRQGHIVGAVTVYRDITHQRRLEREREIMMQLVAHDLTHPFTIIQMSQQLMRAELDRGRAMRPSQLRELLDFAEGASSQLARLYADFRTVSLIDAGELAVERAPTDLTALVREVAGSLARTTSREVSIEVPKRPVKATVDRDRIAQVLTNLLDNAFKYSPADGLVRVRLRRVGGPIATQEAQEARIEVCDSGPGIPKQTQARIFERFYRVQETRLQAGAERGLGLGLFISRYFVQRHGGQMGVRSRTRLGATFWFTLPLMEQADA